MILPAVTGPMPGSDSSAAWSALLRSMRLSSDVALLRRPGAEGRDQHLGAVRQRRGEVQRAADLRQVHARSEASGRLHGITDTGAVRQLLQAGPRHGPGDVDDDAAGRRRDGASVGERQRVSAEAAGQQTGGQACARVHAQR